MNESETMVSEDQPEWILPNQSYTISNQLKLGVRSLLFDTYYGEPQSGKIVNVSKAVGMANGDQTFMCHFACSFGAVDLTSELGRIKDFLVANPREVLIFINEDYIAPQDFAKAVDASGLLPYVYQGSDTQYPTLGEMINSNQRVVMFAQDDAGDVPWYHLGYSGPMMETPYSFTETPQITAPDQLNESCRPNRGTEGSPLFLMNHWILEGDTRPVLAAAEIDNSKEAIVARAKACESRRGKLPNIIAVDFFGTGDVLGAVRELNGVTAKPYLEVTAPMAAKVKSKRKATFQITISNFGDIEATDVTVCASVRSGLARKPGCTVVTPIPTNGSAVAQLKVKTKKRYRKGAGAVRFSITSSQPTLTTSAKLTVKPLKKPKKHKKKQQKKHKKRG